MADPIATFHEVRLEQKRLFRLFEDRIEIEGRSINSRFETKIPLKSLNPAPERIWIRDSAFSHGFSLVLCAVFFLIFVMIALSDMTELPRNAKIGITLFELFLGIGGAVLMAANWRKLEYLNFKNTSEVVILNIGKVGKEKGKFDSFIELFVQQIKSATDFTQGA
jgi:hypothetical protein